MSRNTWLHSPLPFFPPYPAWLCPLMKIVPVPNWMLTRTPVKAQIWCKKQFGDHISKMQPLLCWGVDSSASLSVAGPLKTPHVAETVEPTWAGGMWLSKSEFHQDPARSNVSVARSTMGSLMTFSIHVASYREDSTSGNAVPLNVTPSR